MKTPSSIHTSAKSWCLAISILLSNPVASQVYLAELPTLTVPDPGSIHISFLSPRPRAFLTLPSLDTAGAGFFNFAADVMVVPKSNGEEFYVDKNGNGDLSDDGSPAFFSRTQTHLVVECCRTINQTYTAPIVISRSPDFPDTGSSRLLDDDGNLKKGRLKWWRKMLRDTCISGDRGRFYFTDQLSLRRGTIALEGKTYDIGIALNGLTSYDDTSNTVVIDRNCDHTLSIFPQEHDNEAYKMSDVFEIGGKNFKVVKADKQGAWLEVEQSVASPTSHYLEQAVESIGKAGELLQTDPRIWELTLQTINGKTIKLKNYKGNYLLINIWGEWCGPCLAEMPVLQHASVQYAAKGLQIVGFIKMFNRGLALKVIEEQKISWPQIVLTKEVEDFLQPRGFPTNMLVFPDGKIMKVTNVVNEKFFRHNIH